MSITSPNPPATAADPTSRAATLVVDAVRQGRTFSSDDSWVLLPPDLTRWDPFVLLVEDEFSTRGFPWHPHRGFQTLTYVLDGRLEHRDNAGGAGVLARGDAQYMVAGRYAMHYELAHEFQPVRTLQTWINLPKRDKLGPTSYVDLQHLAARRIEQPGVVAHLHVGSVAGHTGADATLFKVPITLLDAQLRSSASFDHEVPGDHAVAVHVVSGAVRVGATGTPVGARQTAWFDPVEAPAATTIPIEAETDSFVIIYSGQPIGEPVAFGGPFLMSTEDENAQAMADFHAGLFGPLPNDPTPTDAATRR
jgi:quercetin 2,3-dioxygenase